jgi:hypothetical protein
MFQRFNVSTFLMFQRLLNVSTFQCFRGRGADEGHLRGHEVPPRHEHRTQRSKAGKPPLLKKR